MTRLLPDGSKAAPPQIATPALQLVDRKRRLPDWISAFLDYTDMAESPHEYLQWTAISTIAGAAQRKIYTEFEYFFYHSNLYVILVGPPGSKKGTAIRQGRKLLAQVPGVNLSSDAPSVAAVMEELVEIKARCAEHQSLNAFILELSTLYENAKEQMTGFLTAIYDGEKDYAKRTRSFGKELVPYPWLNLIAATTPSWLGENMGKTAVEGGLAARSLYVFSDEMVLKSPRPKRAERYKKLEAELVHDLRIISSLSGEFEWEPTAGDWYDAWYLDKKRFPRITDNRTAGYFVRKPAHLVKVAMAVALARRNDLVLTLDDLLVGLAFLDSIEPGITRAFSSVGGNAYANDLERLESQIKQAGKLGISYADLVAANYHALDKKNLDQTLDALMAMQTVIKSITGGMARYFFVFGTKGLHSATPTGPASPGSS